ncbi:MAG: tetratricopeptide repeat protein, partial [Proteobacteria bacterium]|nr:tetratricopeptide repeat protein [Pseudomonadota bacterium]
MGYQNLADLQFRTGELELGLESAKKGLDAAEKANSDMDISTSKAYLAGKLHLLGKDEEADNWFRQADELQIKVSDYRLYGISGIFYVDFLLSMKRIDEAFELTKQNLEICQRNNWTNDISRCHRCLGAIERIKGKPNEAEVHLQNALEIARKVGVPFLEIETLLESSRLHLDKGRHKDAIRAANEVLKICARTG